MKFIAFSLCLLVTGVSYAQTSSPNAKKNNHKSAVAGVIKDMRKQPIEGVRAFVYRKDSIMASGYTDATGYYETNSTFPGVYDLKLVYPSAKVVMITGVPIKAAKLTMLDLKMGRPDADTAISYGVLVPKPPTPAKKAKTPNP